MSVTPRPMGRTKTSQDGSESGSNRDHCRVRQTIRPHVHKKLRFQAQRTGHRYLSNAYVMGVTMCSVSMLPTLPVLALCSSGVGDIGIG